MIAQTMIAIGLIYIAAMFINVVGAAFMGTWMAVQETEFPGFHMWLAWIELWFSPGALLLTSLLSFVLLIIRLTQM
jgi:hypothetical protein